MDKEYFKKCLAEVEKKVRKPPKTAPAHRKLFKQGYSFSELSPSEQLIIWDYIWKNASDFWARGHAFLYLESKMKNKEFLLNSWETIKKWQNVVDNWGLCDGLAKIYTKTLELIPEQVLTQLEMWNKSKNLWDRRQSIVSLLYFSRTKKVVLPYGTIIKFINRLIDDKEYYVQKAVGWSLKELYNVYPKETLRYLEDNIKRISAIAFSPATEKIKKKDKEKLKRNRNPIRI
jgi:3-methyladenine DNA glycosylase AlkD